MLIYFFQNCNMRKSVRTQYVLTVKELSPAVACVQFCMRLGVREVSEWMCWT